MNSVHTDHWDNNEKTLQAFRNVKVVLTVADDLGVLLRGLLLCNAVELAHELMKGIKA